MSPIRKQYDFSAGVRGRYAAQAKRGSNIVVLDPDVAVKFKTSRAVNRALRTLLPSAVRPSGSHKKQR